MTLTVLFFAALASATISGLVGMAGGITLLAIMTFFFPLTVIVPLHGVAQLVSNSSRAFILRRSVKREVMVVFAAGTSLGAVGAYLLLGSVVGEDLILGFIIFLLSYTALKPKKLPQLRLGLTGFGLLGTTAGLLGPLMGATGPLLAPFFARDDYSKEEIVATKAACQFFIHIIKLPLFLALAFPYTDYLLEIAVMVVGVLLGTRLGTWLLKRASTQGFMLLLKCALLVTAARLIYKLSVGG